MHPGAFGIDPLAKDHGSTLAQGGRHKKGKNHLQASISLCPKRKQQHLSGGKEGQIAETRGDSLAVELQGCLVLVSQVSTQILSAVPTSVSPKKDGNCPPPNWRKDHQNWRKTHKKKQPSEHRAADSLKAPLLPRSISPSVLSPMAIRWAGLSALALWCFLLIFDAPNDRRGRRLQNFQGTAVASALHFLECPSWHRTSVTRVVAGVLVALSCVTLVGLLVSVGMLCLQKAWRLDSPGVLLKQKMAGMEIQSVLKYGALVTIAASVAVAALLSEPAAVRLAPALHQHISVPLDLTQCRVHFLHTPELFPIRAGADLSIQEQNQRQEYFVSILLWLTLAGFLAGTLLTLLGNACRGQRQHVYAPLDADNPALALRLCEHVGIHAVCAGLTVLAVATERLDLKAGACWEMYVVWATVMIGRSLVLATYFTCSLPTESELPLFGFPVIQSILPVLGEPLDIFKDWLFIGLAMSKWTWQGISIAAVGLLALFLSNAYMRQHHAEELARMLSPIRESCFPSKGGFLVRQTSPAKLAVVLSEDLPQACLQSLFAACYGGSTTQHVFIAIGCVKAAMCLSLRAAVLQSEGRWGEAYEASLEFYKMKVSLLSATMGPRRLVTLHAQAGLAQTLHKLGKHEEALHIEEEVRAARAEILGDRHPDTINAQVSVAITLQALGRSKEALQMKQEVLTARAAILGDRHPDTISAQATLATTLQALGKKKEALHMEQKVLAARAEILGDRHPDTIKARNNLASTLHGLGRYEDALHMEQEVLTARATILGDRHPDTIHAQANLADTLRKLGKHEKALQMEQEVMAARAEVLGERHPDTIKSRNHLANALHGLSRYEEALQMKREVLAATWLLLGNLLHFCLLWFTGKSTRLLKFVIFPPLPTSTKATAERFGDCHPDTINARNNVATTLHALGKHKEAELVRSKLEP